MTAARLSNPTGRNTKACVVELGAHSFFFSYATCIAYAGPLGRARRANAWRPTTGRHFRELGCGGFPVVEADELDAIVLRAVAGTQVASDAILAPSRSEQRALHGAGRSEAPVHRALAR